VKLKQHKVSQKKCPEYRSHKMLKFANSDHFLFIGVHGRLSLFSFKAQIAYQALVLDRK
jgi:hypothetical protein